MALVVLSVPLPLLIAHPVNLVHHLSQRNALGTVWKSLTLETTAVEIGNEDEPVLGTAGVYEVLVADLLQPGGRFIAGFLLLQQRSLRGGCLKKLTDSFDYLHSNRRE
jgi:hypothetical protein